MQSPGTTKERMFENISSKLENKRVGIDSGINFCISSRSSPNRRIIFILAGERYWVNSEKSLILLLPLRAKQ